MTSKKCLVAYFSFSGDTYNVGIVKEGNTKLLANHISSILKANQFHIIGDNKYPQRITDIANQSRKEKEEKIRPKLISKIENFEQYDTIFLGYPIWFGDYPMVVYTFLENYDFTNKNVIPFCTHEGSKSAGTFEKLKKLLPRANVNINGLDMFGSKAREPGAKQIVEKWIKQLNIII